MDIRNAEAETVNVWHATQPAPAISDGTHFMENRRVRLNSWPQHQVGAIHKSNVWRFSFITFSEINVHFENYRFS